MRKENRWEIRSDILKMMELIMKAICLSFFSRSICSLSLFAIILFARLQQSTSQVQSSWNGMLTFCFQYFFLLLFCQAARSIWVHSHRNYMSKHYAKHIEINSHFTLEIKYVARVEKIHVIAPVLLALVGSVLISKISNSFSARNSNTQSTHNNEIELNFYVFLLLSLLSLRAAVRGTRDLSKYKYLSMRRQRREAKEKWWKRRDDKKKTQRLELMKLVTLELRARSTDEMKNLKFVITIEVDWFVSFHSFAPRSVSNLFLRFDDILRGCDSCSKGLACAYA